MSRSVVCSSARLGETRVHWTDSLSHSLADKIEFEFFGPALQELREYGMFRRAGECTFIPLRSAPQAARTAAQKDGIGLGGADGADVCKLDRKAGAGPGIGCAAS